MRSKLPLVILGVFLLSCIFLAPELMAQDAAEGAGDAAGKKMTLWDLIMKGGWAMIPLAALSVAMITLFVFNLMQLTRKKFVPLDLKANVLAFMSEVRVRSAIEESANSPSFLGRMLASSLPFVDATQPETLGRQVVEDEMADFTVKEVPAYMTWIGYFSVIAQASPMIGLLGTVSGMIKAFQNMDISGGADPGELANNISEALVTTASGLVVAIPCLFCFYFFKNRLNRLVTEAHLTVAEGLDLAIATVNADQQMAKVPEGITEA